LFVIASLRIRRTHGRVQNVVSGMCATSLRLCLWIRLKRNFELPAASLFYRRRFQIRLLMGEKKSITTGVRAPAFQTLSIRCTDEVILVRFRAFFFRSGVGEGCPARNGNDANSDQCCAPPGFFWGVKWRQESNTQ